uniref:Uncharacterized protein n=1 Tax=Leucosporidium scottii TaxID=5278 RepID=A0A0H5G9Q4_9BASI|nr:hypothetical protein [Leucosporidium scottii]
MVSDLKGVESSRSVSTPTSTAISASTSTASTKLIRRELSPDPPFLGATSPSLSSPTAMATLVRRHQLKREVRTSSSETPIKAVTAAARASSTTASATASTDTTTCAYVGDTTVPKQVGGVLFSTLERIFCAIILIFALLAEIPPHSRFTQRFWTYAFPPFGESFGTGVLGVVQVFVGCSALSHSHRVSSPSARTPPLTQEHPQATLLSMEKDLFPLHQSPARARRRGDQSSFRRR